MPDSHTTKRLLKAVELKDNHMQRIEHQGRAYLVCRVKDQVYAMDDRCTHEDVSLSLGALQDHCIRCPLHGSRFDVRTGQVLDEPAEENLTTYPITVVEGWICLK
ncbi:MAG: non-heme iron oxygenase ferredoxin subunit [Granulosicoccus sp.]|nr:non-heme iron oxygenase ferredoxin subunit [Granulosicoccus sp.]